LNYEKGTSVTLANTKKKLNLESLEEVFTGRVFLVLVNDGVWGVKP